MNLETSQIIFNSNPVNLDFINSKFNDYNVTFPPPLIDRKRSRKLITYFSSDRNSKGKEFDINLGIIEILVEPGYHFNDIFVKQGTLTDEKFTKYSKVLKLINSNQNEYGPLFFRQSRNKSIFLFGTDDNKNIEFPHMFDIKFYENDNVFNARKLNSKKDDYYPTFLTKYTQKRSFKSREIEEIYFCSNRDSSYNIYNITLPENEEITTFLQNEPVLNEVKKNNILSSSADDKCPYINNKYMVFTSNREGGFGGFDLYYSIYENKKWSKPINFGDKINTEYDEYRPVIVFDGLYENDFMIFSSNRPGGKGGFDLYYVGTNKLLN